MKTAEREMWIKALRSGEYEQTKGTLRRNLNESTGQKEKFGYCCLGVAADLSKRGEWDQNNTYRLPEGKVFNGWGTLCNLSAGDYFAQGESIFSLPGNIRNYLAHMNDEGSSFEEIALYIETLPVEDEG